MNAFTIPIQSSAMAPAPSAAMAPATAPQSWWDKLIAWVKDRWQRLVAWLRDKESNLVAGVGRIKAVNALSLDNPVSGWSIRCLGSGCVAPLSDAEARVAAEAAEKAPKGVGTAVLSDSAGIGVTLSRAQTLAAGRAIQSFASAHQAMVDISNGAAVDPLGCYVPPCPVPYRGGMVLVGPEHWNRALTLAAEGKGVGEGQDPRVDAALALLSVAEDPETVEEVAADAADGGLESSAVFAGLVAANVLACRAVALKLARGILSGDEGAIEAARELRTDAESGDDDARGTYLAMQLALAGQ